MDEAGHSIYECDPSLTWLDRTDLERKIIDENTTEMVDQAGNLVVRNTLVETLPPPRLPIPEKLIRS